MKKLIAVITALCLALSLTAAFAEGTTAVDHVVKEGIQYGMTQADVAAQLGNARIEIDTERTHGGITFTEIEVENFEYRGKRADVHFLFYNDKLVAAHVDFEDNAVAYNELRDMIQKDLPDATPYDLGGLGTKIYALDDDGRLEGMAEAFMVDNKLLVIEQDEEDVNLYMLDLSSEF